ncbi:MMPL family transporter [Cruoricaptor ignavus]|uniref:MMPL family transporter n=1 Tax=Cruoricaptor ignavus TaxID=1118202 RepID=UPI00370DC538
MPWLLGLLAILGLCFLCINKINFEEDISQIIPKSDKADITAKVLKQQNFSDKVIVIIEKKNASQDYALSETADDFLEKIEPLKPYTSDVQGKVDDEEILQSFHFISENLPIFLEEKDYEIISQKLNSDSISQKISDNFSAMLSPTSVVTKNFIRKDPLGFSAIALKKLNSLNSGSNFQLEDNYVVSENGQHLLLFIEPKFGGSETKNNEKFAEGLEKIRGELNQKYRGKTEISYFGAPLIAVANAKQIKHDIQSTVLVSMALLLLLLIFYFKNWLTPLIIFIPTAVSAVISLAIIYFIKDRISAVSLSISAILVGLTVDYALHILTHYKHKTNIAELYREITQPVLMSAATTAVSFLCLVFVRSEALKDLGIFAAITVMLSAIFSLIIIPQIYRPKAVEIEPKKTLIDKVAGYPFERYKFLIISCLITIPVCLFGFSKVKFNSDISDLNFVPEEMQQSEAKLQSITDLAEKSVYVFSYGKTAEEALKHNTKVAEFLRQEKSGGNILNFTSSGEILIPESLQGERITRWKNFWDDAKKAEIIAKIKSAGKPAVLVRALLLSLRNCCTETITLCKLMNFRNFQR